MFHAVEGNQLALVMLFRQCNANLELTNYAGITALMAAQAKGFSEASSVLMVGLDPKAIIEHKEKEKMMMPNKKVTDTELYYMNCFIMSRLLCLQRLLDWHLHELIQLS